MRERGARRGEFREVEQGRTESLRSGIHGFLTDPVRMQPGIGEVLERATLTDVGSAFYEEASIWSQAKLTIKDVKHAVIDGVEVHDAREMTVQGTGLVSGSHKVQIKDAELVHYSGQRVERADTVAIQHSQFLGTTDVQIEGAHRISTYGESM